MKFPGKVLGKQELLSIHGGGPSLRKCQRLIRRSDRHRSRGDKEGAQRLIKKFEDIGCASTTFTVSN
ncbi:hypothetical protein [uncultured Tenacibaculum sp.]|uniref:hypothetical protein n=1 Tax=uncultured Tenacibaculum sp. TaxID=174713 RepID=UPI0026077A1E|nr:hypothetical protein [uncultured Tenacibaculum sp.]